jgi:two-component system, LytTR family, response regulator LytT
VNILIVEDEAPAARRLERMVRDQLGERITSLAIAATADAARAALGSSHVDLLLLDLNLNGDDGFSILAGGPRPPTIVVSANAGRAIDAFDNAVIDFVAKPVSAERIDLAPLSDIVALSGADDYVEVILFDGRRYLHDARLGELERRLPSNFARVHRSHIVNTAHIRTVQTQPNGRRDVCVTGGLVLPVSRAHAGKVRQLRGPRLPL